MFNNRKSFSSSLLLLSALLVSSCGSSDEVVAPVDSAPSAVADSATVLEDGSVSIDVLLNDSDVEGEVTMGAVTVAPTNGVAVVSGDSVVYTPDADFNGSDSFTYSITDDNDSTSTAVVSITVTSVNDAPVAVSAFTAVLTEDTPMILDLLNADYVTDVDAGDTLEVVPVGDAPHGDVAKDINGNWVYLGDQDYSGDDSFEYEVHDGNGGVLLSQTATLTITNVNDEPVGFIDDQFVDEDNLLAFGISGLFVDADGDSVTIDSVGPATDGTTSLLNGVVTYIPDPNFFGTDSFTVSVTDSVMATPQDHVVSVTIAPVNDAPVALDASFTVDEDVLAAGLDLSPFFSDPEGDPITVTVVTPALNGTRTFNGDGTFDYLSALHFNFDLNGLDTLTYTVTDGALTSSAGIEITVTAVDDTTEVQNGTMPDTNEDTLSSIFDLTTLIVEEVDQDTLTYTIDTQAANGIATIVGDTVTFQPAANSNVFLNGIQTFTVLIDDGGLNPVT
ncbi:MAG: tandem-95 repeat protein, partial [Planctomycetes bacterium]|nr:tandem-95 repeat protein [Planctomycetota bacterium]